MKTTTAQIGRSTLLIETSTVDVEGSPIDRYGTKATGVRQDARNAYDQLKDLLRDIAVDMAESLIIDTPNGPKEVSIELGLTFSSSANVWILSASADVSCNISMTWDRSFKNG
jgi:hypothetical protein